MNVFTVTVVIMIMTFATVFVSVRHFRQKGMSGGRIRFAPFLMTFSIILVISDVFAGETCIMRIPCDLVFSLSPVLLTVSSLWEDDDALHAMVCMASVQVVFLLYYLLSAFGILPMLSGIWFVKLAGIGAVFIAVMFLMAVHMRVREVRLVIKHGNVWSALCVMVDFVYAMFVVVHAFVLMIGASFGTGFGLLVSHLVSLLLALEFGALGIRMANDSLFVVRGRHERRIVESMKISHVEVSPDSAKIEEMYRQIYDRVVQLFETDKLYLNSELTINDIVKIVYTNKLYISRAISQFTGRNFCQFVNYYRVIHSIRLFRENPDLKVAELANQSGFNSSVTFAMAFRLYMSESPSDWCRKEKYKIKGKKK